VTASHALAPRSSSLVPAGDDELSLMALLDLCAIDEPDELGGAPAGGRPSLRPVADRLRAWTKAWSLRATGWGAGPRGSWRAW
jgi:hypothetical protein